MTRATTTERDLERTAFEMELGRSAEEAGSS